MAPRAYAYVGPPEIQRIAAGADGGRFVDSLDDLLRWLTNADAEGGADSATIATFVIDIQGRLRLAARRSEHVACAAGEPVLSAGEIGFRLEDDLPRVEVLTNHSTGYCPEPDTYAALEAALERIGVEHPGGFTTAVIFRRCPSCTQINIVKDDWYVCAVCGHALPRQWNLAPA